jgi:hypothetical protein
MLTQAAHPSSPALIKPNPALENVTHDGGRMSSGPQHFLFCGALFDRAPQKYGKSRLV